MLNSGVCKKVTKSVRFFKYVVANLVICLVVCGVLAFSLRGSTAVATASDPIYKGENKSRISLMVNVYWGTEYIDDMLTIFAQNGVTTTFFIGGMWAAQNDGMLKKIATAGHEIGNHGYFHKDHKTLSAARNAEEIAVTHRLVKSILDYDMTLFAPPSGSFGKTTLEEARKQGYTTVMWTRDTIDWRDHDTEKIFSRATKNMAGGDLILMHPTKNTVEALGRIIAVAKANNLTVSKVSEVLQSS